MTLFITISYKWAYAFKSYYLLSTPSWPGAERLGGDGGTLPFCFFFKKGKNPEVLGWTNL